jgi:hypothetical protein
VQPIPISDAVTTFHAGETITVQWQETVYHPGYFRISLAVTHAADATNTNFPDPALTDPVDCHYDRAAVQTGPHDNVLADGLFMAADQNGTNRSLMQDVKLPNEPCDKCTLQVVQVMEGHPASSCFYFHCAEITILPVDGGNAGASGAAGAGAARAGSSGPGGSGGNLASVAVAGTSGSTGTATATPTSSHKSSGCSIAYAGARMRSASGRCSPDSAAIRSTAVACSMLAIAWARCRRRRPRPPLA